VANSLNSYRDGAVGFIDWLDLSWGFHRSWEALIKSPDAFPNIDRNAVQRVNGANSFNHGRENPARNANDLCTDEFKGCVAARLRRLSVQSVVKSFGGSPAQH
jgi:hypothetical protein